MAEPSMSASQQDELLAEVGRILASAILDKWEEIRFTFSGVVDVSMPTMTVLRPDDSVQTLTPPRKASRLMRELREGTYQPGRGAWFTARYVIEQSGKHRVDYDYDNEPVLDFVLANSAYAADLARFPRDRRHLPAWLQAKLDDL
jgi:hypothetical protein